MDTITKIAIGVWIVLVLFGILSSLVNSCNITALRFGERVLESMVNNDVIATCKGQVLPAKE